MLNTPLFSPAWVATLPAQTLAGPSPITAEFDIVFGTASNYGALCFEWTAGGVSKAMNIAVTPSQLLIRKIIGGTPTDYTVTISPSLGTGVTRLFQFKWDANEITVTLDETDAFPVDTGFSYDGTSCDVSIYTKASIELGHFALEQDGVAVIQPFWTNFVNTREVS